MGWVGWVGLGESWGWLDSMVMVLLFVFNPPDHPSVRLPACPLVHRPAYSG